MKTPSLYGPLQRLLMIQQLIEDNGGEITPEIEEMFEDKTQTLAERAEALVELRCESLMIQVEATRRIARENAVIEAQAKLIERLDKGLKAAVELTGPMQAGTFKLSIRKSESVVITDEAQIPDEYRSPVVIPKTPEKGTPDKAKIKAAIAEGNFVAGAYVDKRNNLQIK